MAADRKIREQWVDVAKGGAIVLVVLFHAALFLDDVGLASVWPRAGTALDTFRMPLFFFTAGLFAAKALALDLRQLVRRRVGGLVWVYAVWTLIWTLAFQILPFLREVPTWSEFAWLLVWPNASTWFVYALAWYFVAAWLLRRLPAVAQLTLAGAVAVVFGTDGVDTGSTALNKMGMYFVFFLAAALFGPVWRAVAQRARPVHAAAAALGYLTALGVVTLADAFRFPGMRLAVSSVAVVLGVTVSVSLAGRPAFGWLERLGRRTLPIYVLHYYPILVLCALVEPISQTFALVAPVLPPVLAAGAITIALLLEKPTRRVPALYALPSWPRLGRILRSPAAARGDDA